MRNKPTIVLAALLLSWVLNPTAFPQAADAIATIRQQYSAINKRAPRARKVKKQLSGYSLEGGELIAYFDGPSIVKIAATHYGEMGRTAEEYYYSHGKLIFVFEKVFHYNRPMTGKVVRTAENRYYFNDGKLIRWIGEDGKEQTAANTDFQLKQKQAVTTSDALLIGARSKASTIEAPN